METGAKLASDHLSLLVAITPPPRAAIPRAGHEAVLEEPVSILTYWLPTTAAESARMRSLLLFALLLLAWVDARQPNGNHHHHRSHCFSPADVPEGHVPTEFLSRARRWDRHTAVQLVPYLERETTERRRQRRHPESKCPSLQLQDLQNSDIHERSISPWNYEINVDEDRYPRRLAFAHCLCKGCIDVKTGRETTSLNSVHVFQEMMVLRRKPCKRNMESAGFTLEVEYIKVPVACACVLPQSTS